MPLYEYYCDSCAGVFELLRPVREAALAQPCPVCDEDAKRIVSKQWSAFTFREGYARRVPDDGGYWHLGQKVSTPVSSSPDGMTHPELAGRPEIEAPSVEELDHFEYEHELQAAAEDAEVPMISSEQLRSTHDLKRRIAKTTDKRAKDAARRRVLRAEQRLAKKKQSQA